MGKTAKERIHHVDVVIWDVVVLYIQYMFALVVAPKYHKNIDQP